METSALFTVIERVRTQSPLVHNITNFVVMNTTANALLAFGASPAMVHASDEVEEFAGLAASLVVNIGTLSSSWIASMRLAALTMQKRDRPWVLDPVGAGATGLRTRTALGLLALGPRVLRGNASEILALYGATGGAPKGVDSRHQSHEAANAARALARTHGMVVAVTGKTDLVTNGTETLLIEGGDPLMARVTGLGCTASALIGATLAVEPDPMLATAAALAALGAAGKAAAKDAQGPASFAVALFDMLYRLDASTLAAGSATQHAAA